MADEQYRWLDPEAAERLLRGEPLENLDATAREQAERLLRALGALSAGPSAATPATSAATADAELPGEAAALAAFRKARAEQADARAALDRPERAVTRTDADAEGLVRIGARAAARPPRARWGRPLRLALAGALAVGAVGGVAAAATTGVLPTPFGGDEPGPAASVSAPATSERPLVSPSPDGTPGGGAGTATPGGATAGSPGGTAGASPGDGATTSGQDDSGAGTGHPQEGDAGRWARVASACRDLRDGKDLGSGRKQALNSAAGGPARVWTYCKLVLKTVDGRGQDGGDTDGNKGGDQGGQHGNENGNGNGNGGGNGNGNGNGGGHGDDEGGHISGGLPGNGSATHPPFGPSLPDRAATHSVPAPAPTYSAL
ncbi:extensin [Streptomyces naganishii]|uniref:Extensin n=1 Tax=Streptomyces naganishii JCM 4654 TaxID=1306179 RepID=A0A919CZK7_9ACTN|nr:extensin [Streptomyces naganishii]GHD94665.1 hypothetical protein GCM10010508_56400 [Streptomyces naganishii JCM 4654]